jgi:histidinol-phosphate aminotransferase
MNIKNIVNELDSYVPGKSISEIAEAHNLEPEDIIKLGSNENPLGPSPRAVKAVCEKSETMHRYPESDLSALTQELSAYNNIAPEKIIIAGDGADEILDIMAKTFIEPGDEFIVHIPTYMYYEYTLGIHGAKPIFASWNIEKNKLDVDSVLNALSEKTKIIFLCTPNNPTGGIIDREDIITVLNATKALVVVDEAYYEFSGANNQDLIDQYDNLFIVRTFSKVMGLAGMRIGYGLSNPQIIEYMHRVKPVFSLTSLSQIAALETLKDREYIEKSIEMSIKSREYLYTELKKLNKIKVFRSYANYLLVDIRETGKTSGEMTDLLMETGVIVRNCSSFRGLDDYYIRISVGTMEEDAKFIKIFKKLIQN